jgi:hypothetical protein
MINYDFNGQTAIILNINYAFKNRSFKLNILKLLFLNHMFWNYRPKRILNWFEKRPMDHHRSFRSLKELILIRWL